MVHEQFQRIERMIGGDGLGRLQRAHVAVIGLGAVGSYAAEALARAGIGRLRLVDFDEIRTSNINRQLYALHSTVGQFKVDVARQRIADINPACQIEALRAFVHIDTMQSVVAGPPDVVIDAIDSFTPKLELISALAQRQIPFISSMGAALRTDPTCIRLGPIREIHHCPLAAKIRKKLRRRGIPLEFPCVYSTEPVEHLPEAAVDRDPGGEPNLLARGRPRRTLGSLPTLTGIFGLTAANAALAMLLPDGPIASSKPAHPSRTNRAIAADSPA